MKGYETKKLVEGVKSDVPETRKAVMAGLKAALASGQIDPKQFNANRLFAECFGQSLLEEYRDEQGFSFQQVKETAGATSTSAFLNITQQFMASNFQDAYEIPEQIFTKLIPTVSTKRRFERVAGVSQIGDEAQLVEEGKEYPLVGPSEDWTDTPEARKRGMTAAITKETLMFDETNLVVERVRAIGEWLGINHEKRAIDCIVDENTLNHRYNWRGVVYSSYRDTPWDNLSAASAFVDYKSLDTVRQLFMGITDPQTGEPQGFMARHLIVPPSLQLTAAFALGGIVQQLPGGFATSGTPTRSELPNPINTVLGMSPMVVSSQLLISRMAVKTSWFLGDITKYAEYREVWPVTLDQIGAGSQNDFDRDIVQQWKASSMGAFRVKNPRALVKATV